MANVAYVITQLSSKAKEWVTSVWEVKLPFCMNYKAFVEEIKKVFDCSKHGREAAREMLHIRQGRRSVSDYAIQFHTLVSSSGWNPEAQFFLNGLSEEIKDELMTREPPADFDALVDLTIRIDASSSNFPRGECPERSSSRGDFSCHYSGDSLPIWQPPGVDSPLSH